MRCSRWFLVGTCGLALAFQSGRVSAADPVVTPKPPEDIQKQWSAAIEQRSAVVQKMQLLFQKAEKADDATKQQLFQEFQKIQQTFMTQVQPQIIKLAPQVYAQDPQNKEAASIVLAMAYEANDYPKILKVSEPLLKDANADPLVYNIAGLAHFATSDFAGARELFAKASKGEPRMYEQLSARYANALPEYVGFWEREQKIRAAETKVNDLPHVLFKTSRGEIEFELFENEAPNAVANFISLVEAGKYNGTRFHRVIPNFMAQGGDPNSANDDPSDDGLGGPGYTIACECYQENARKHFQGSLSMAHAGKDSGGSQFFITHLPTPHLNANPAEQRGHTVFGRVVKGIEVALQLKKGDKIDSATVLRKRNHKYEPTKLPEKNPR